MKRNGFTLTEVVLAVIIVGLVGIAVASLSVVVSRESAATNSHILLRNTLSAALRQMRQDIQTSTVLSDTPVWITKNVVNEDCRTFPYVQLLRLRPMGEDKYIVYFLQAGRVKAYPGSFREDVVSIGYEIGTEPYLKTVCYLLNPSLGGGRIVRRVFTKASAYTSACDTDCDLGTQECAYERNFSDCFTEDTKEHSAVLLENVKFIPNNVKIDDTRIQYQVPLFRKMGGNAVKVNLIVEIPDSTPIVNEAVEEVFFTQ